MCGTIPDKTMAAKEGGKDSIFIEALGVLSGCLRSPSALLQKVNLMML
jgi:hypothetical protein